MFCASGQEATKRKQKRRRGEREEKGLHNNKTQANICRSTTIITRRLCKKLLSFPRFVGQFGSFLGTRISCPSVLPKDSCVCRYIILGILAGQCAVVQGVPCVSEQLQAEPVIVNQPHVNSRRDGFPRTFLESDFACSGSTTAPIDGVQPESKHSFRQDNRATVMAKSSGDAGSKTRAAAEQL